MRYFFFALILLLFTPGYSFAQERTSDDVDRELDSLRKRDEGTADTVIFTSRYIRYTTIGLLKDSTRTVPLDTSLNNFENYSPLYQPDRPTVNLGNLGLAARDMLFNPEKSIGFDPGFHSLDIYRLTQDSLKYYRARSPYTSLYYVNGTKKEQTFRVTHSQNIKPNWNIGANYFRIGAEGFYINQNADHLNGSVFTWYESPRKRYNILANGVFNTLKAAENGGPVTDVFGNEPNANIDAPVRLTGFDPVKQIWREKNFFLKQFYYIGRIDSVSRKEAASILPTQRISHSFSYSSNRYKFYKNQEDNFFVFPHLRNAQGDAIPDQRTVEDSTEVKNLRNEFMYSFYLRGRSVKFIKNEMKLDVGLQHDFYRYSQMGYTINAQNTMLKANIGYRFSDRIFISGQLNQIAQGRNAGDYLYNAQMDLLLSKSVGRLIFGAYIQNKSPEVLMERSNYTYHPWANSFDNIKINNLSFAYENRRFNFRAKADYFLLNNYLYYTQKYLDEGQSLLDTNQIVPVQAGSAINLLKVSVNKDFHFGRFGSNNLGVFQKTDFQNILRTPELYIYNSLYFVNSFFKKALTANLGVDSRWNSSFNLPSYAINVGQFYNGASASDQTYPVIGVYGKFALKRANILVRYDYLNQGLFSKGYYTVDRYPMPDALFKFGVWWNFYN